MNPNFREPDSRRRFAPQQGRRPIIIESTQVISGNLWITMSDGLTYNVGPVTGEQGPPGPQGNPGPPGQQGQPGPPGVRDIQQIRITTEPDGTAQWDFDPNFPGIPYIAYAIQDTDPEPYAMVITQVTAAFVRIQLRHAQTLPAVLNSLNDLVSYDIFAGAALGGITVHLLAFPPAPVP